MKKILFTLCSLCCCSFYIHAQHMVSGKVTDDSGSPIFYLVVMEKGTNNGTFTNVDGEYTLNASKADALLIFSYIGYQPQEINISGKATLNVVMGQGEALNAIEIVGSRRLNRTAMETPVAVDIIDVSRFTTTTGQLDINQLLQYAAPSFNASKQSGADGADHIDPATLRGLGPDQTLVLLNGKRRHQSSVINIFGTRGRGNTGTDLNAIPASAIDHIEVLRDGASAQYGSDAIAGVINIVLKKNVEEFTGMVTMGARNATPDPALGALSSKDYDGETVQASANYGVNVGTGGFVNMNLDYLDSKHTNRPSDPEKFDIYRNQFGDAASTNFSYYLNSEFNGGDNARIYAFGGYNYRFTDAFAWSRSADEERNVTSIYPNGFDPHIQSAITDKSLSFGVRSNLNRWNMDINNTYGSNRFHFLVDGTLNATLEDKSPTHFDAGGFSLMQNTTGINMSRLWQDIASGFNLALGVEHRVENYEIFAGEEASWKDYGPVVFSADSVFDDEGNFAGIDTTFRPGGSQGFPGFRPSNELDETRTNIGAYADAELDVTEKFLVSAALRAERYSDFGSTTNGKVALRYKLTNWLSIRAAGSTGFRAPSLAQLHYNTTFTNFIAGVPIDAIIARNNSPITRALGIPALKQEKSTNVSYGITANWQALSITLDGYMVQIEDRIVLTGTFYDDDPDIGADLQAQGAGAAQFFTNAVNTTTSGVDAIITYTFYMGDNHTLRPSLAANFNMMTIDDVYTNDKLAGKENTYFGLREQYFLLASAPESKINFTLDYTMRNFFASARMVNWGKMEMINWNDNGDDVVDDGELDTFDPKITIDLSAGYKFKNVSLTLGGTNILNEYPDPHDPGLTESGGLWDAAQMGFSGAFYFTKLGFKF
ncbi:MAG: TonB-dependent receptor [Flavobacteriales bacterium]|nr:TonB-dependent receptor [Flavobacteriales bacterium]